VESAIAGLATLFQSTRNEVAELRSVVSANQAAVTNLINSVGLVPQGQSVVASGSSLTQAQGAAVSNGSVAGVCVSQPTLSSLRADAQLAAQAEQLVVDASSSVSGIRPSSNTLKRGLIRSGGDLSPIVSTPWPQDYVLGSGNKLKLYYEDLSIYEWVNGYITIIQNQPDPAIQRFMFDHLRNLMEDAVFFGWEAVKPHTRLFLQVLKVGPLLGRMN
jgi:uncharacterized membrane-anchored protein